MIMYTSNERLPELRAKAVKMVRSGKTTREVAKYFGYSQSTIVKWCKKVESKDNFERIETLSSRPHNSPKKILKELEMKIVNTRLEHKRCADIIHKILIKEGEDVSLPTVKRVIKRNGLSKKRSPWKKKRIYPPKPDILAPGDLIQIDTVHITKSDMTRTYIYTAIDIYSRIAYAKRYEKCNTHNSISFLKYIMKASNFNIKAIQTDNGPEFSKFFTDYANRVKISHRHIHPRSPNENGHLERFNRTVQEEPYKLGETYWQQKSLDKYMYYYNHKRMHLGIDGKVPIEMLNLK